jgi:hypothetical protein
MKPFEAFPTCPHFNLIFKLEGFDVESLDLMPSTNVSLLGWLPTFGDLNTPDEI